MANIYDVIYYANPWDITKTSPQPLKVRGCEKGDKTIPQ